MNRIEQVAMPIPAQPQPRLPRARRATSGVAVAIAALAVPLLPGMAFGTTSSGGAGATATEAPSQARHHLPHGPVLPGPGVLTLQAWTASGWTLTVPARDGRYVPWTGEPGLPIDHPRPVILPDGKRGEIADYRVVPTGLRADDPHVPEAQIPADPADPADSTGSDGSTGSVPSGDASMEWPSRDTGDTTALRAARSPVVPDPLIPFSPANTKQMMSPSRTDADIPNGAVTPAPAVGQTAVVTAADLPTSSYCLRDAYPAGGDRYMVAHLRPAADAMDVVATPHRTVCGARVDYLSQARA
ncbi:hypothetical protein ABH926_007887 [Catenulispora sp. GP43]|uniref:hypothetical protein n=1 Tax=Catenulispora sp. GP43 TaxID=3156263 RepID=UPI0035140C1E